MGRKRGNVTSGSSDTCSNSTSSGMAVFSLTTMRSFFPLDLTSYPGTLAYLARIGEREAYRRAMKKGDPELVPVLGAKV